ncbi:MAG: ATP synthase F1 subunit gamma [Microscillaceae bacterium]|nr:ATP synthase F1 subunit gamma [Microscillaceae bacterium]
MPSLKEIRNRIYSVNSTQQITKAMKMVAAAKLRRAQERITQMRPYAAQLGNILQNLTASLDEQLATPLTTERAPERILIIPISSDRGLCGAFNANVLKASLQLANEKYAAQQAAGQLTFLPLGRKVYDSLRRRGYQVNAQFVEIFTDLNFNAVKALGEYLIQQYEKQAVDRVELIFNEFKNVVTQIVRVRQFLPLAAPETPIEVPAETSNTDYLLEPSRDEIIEELLPKTLKIQLYRAVLESNASEQGARMTAMDNATENANELLKELRLTYNRSRQAAITKEILEIVGGAEALKATS